MTGPPQLEVSNDIGLCSFLFLTVKPDYRRQNVTDAVDFQMQLAKPAHFGGLSRSKNPVVAPTFDHSSRHFPSVVRFSEEFRYIYHCISWGLSPLRKLKELAR
jgi:hypothetical protein